MTEVLGHPDEKRGARLGKEWVLCNVQETLVVQMTTLLDKCCRVSQQLVTSRLRLELRKC